ncbi:putative signal transducing protein [Lysobacter olei]
MKVVYEAANLIDAHLVRHALEAEGIPVFLRGEQLLGGMGELPLFGVVAVCVPDVVWSEAKTVVDALPLNAPDGEAMDPCDDGMLPDPA